MTHVGRGEMCGAGMAGVSGCCEWEEVRGRGSECGGDLWQREVSRVRVLLEKER